MVTFRGREQSHMDLGNVLLDKVTNDLEVRDSRCFCFCYVSIKLLIVFVWRLGKIQARTS